MGPTWGPSGADRTQVDPMLAPWILLSGNRRIQTLHISTKRFRFWESRIFCREVARNNFRSNLKDATLGEFRSMCKDRLRSNPNDTPLQLQHMVEHDLHYIKRIVADYFVFEWSMDAITWYAYTFFFPGRYIIVVILHKVYCAQDKYCQWISPNQFTWTMDNTWYILDTCRVR